ncbi:MAG: hypothetical protein AB7G93_15800 [Bdellovibrionales bacterium]
MENETYSQHESSRVEMNSRDKEERPRSSLRLLYEAEIRLFKAQHGGIEQVRHKLGFSRRKICQLLMVDPSAWTRWCRDENRVPPHIYRALEWYLALNHKLMTQPDLATWFNLRHRHLTQIASDKEPDQIELLRQVQSLQTEILRQRWLMAGLILLWLGSMSVWWFSN